NIDEVIDCLSSRITYLGVSGNPLREIKPDMFERFQNLDILQMDHTDLQSIDFNVFKHCENLRYVHISGNNLTNANFILSPNKRSKLQGLWVDGNNLTELPGLNNASYPSLKQLSVYDNPMSCEYVTKLKEQWTILEVTGDQCVKKQTRYGNNKYLVIETTTENIPKVKIFLEDVVVIMGIM
ncbi:MAG: leucine-rich repeat domain-containing protein, partial [Cytophagaceae bacterium]